MRMKVPSPILLFDIFFLAAICVAIQLPIPSLRPIVGAIILIIGSVLAYWVHIRNAKRRARKHIEKGE